MQTKLLELETNVENRDDASADECVRQNYIYLWYELQRVESLILHSHQKMRMTTRE